MKKTLRNLFFLCCAAVAGLFTVSCAEQEVPFLIVDHEVVLVGPATDKGTVEVKSNVSWKASSEAEWITIDNGYGNHKGTFEFFVAANRTPDERAGKIKLEGGSCQLTILVRQTSEGTKLAVSCDTVYFTKDADVYNMSIVCNNDWKVMSSASWCTTDPTNGDGNGNMVISVTENTTGSDRVAALSISSVSDGVASVKNIYVFQSASNATLVVAPEAKTVGASGEEFVVSVVSTGNWEASVEGDWVLLDAIRGTGDAQFVAKVAANNTGVKRQTLITFATGKENENRVVRQIVVSQEASDFYLVLPVTDYPLSREAQSIEVPYELSGSNVTLAAATNVDWISVQTPADGKCQVTVAENTTAYAREGLVVFTTEGQAGEPIVKAIRVAQAPTVNVLEVLSSEYPVIWQGAVVRIPFHANTEVTARSSESWANVTVDGQDIVITVDENLTALERNAIVTVRTESEAGEIISKITKVHQAAANSDLVVSPSKKTIYATANSFIASIVTNNSWTASVDSPWLTIDATEGVGDYKITATAEANKTGEARKALITVETGTENAERQVATIEVTQIAEAFYFVVPIRNYVITNQIQPVEIAYRTSGNQIAIQADTDNIEWIRNVAITDSTVCVNVNENRTAQTRVGTVAITATPQAGDPQTIYVTITQAPTVNILDAYQDEISVSPFGETVNLPFYSNLEHIEAVSSHPWCQVKAIVAPREFYHEYSALEPDVIVWYDEKSESTLEITCEANNTAAPRKAIVTLTTISEKGDRITHIIDVYQAAKNAALLISPEVIEKTAKDVTATAVAVKSTGSWTASVDESWVTLSKTSGFGDDTFNVTLAVNETGRDRVATIIVMTGTEYETRLSKQVTVVQYASDTYLSIPTASYLLSKEEQPLDVALTIAGDVKEQYATCDSDWITVGKLSESNLALEVAENTTAEVRTATVTVTVVPVLGEPIVKSFTVTQSPTINILDVYADTFEVSAEGETLAFAYYANTDLGCSVTAPWLTLGETAEDPDMMSVVIDRNETAEPRTASVVITNINEKGEKLVKVVTINQRALNTALEVHPDVFNVGATETSVWLGIVCKDNWAVQWDQTWIQPSTREGNGDKELEIEIAENTTGAPRSCTLTVFTGTENEKREIRTVTINQAATDTYLEVPQTAYAVSKDRQSLAVPAIVVGDIEDVVVASNGSWCEPEFASDVVTLAITENTTGEVRTAQVTVTVVPVKGEAFTKTITVSQAPTVNILDVYEDVLFANPAGEAINIYTYANTAVDTKALEKWCTATVSGDVTTITVEANKTAKLRVSEVVIKTAASVTSGETLTKVIKLYQGAQTSEIVVIDELKVVSALEGHFDINILSNGEWIVNTNEPWLTVEKTPRLQVGDGTVTFKVEENKTGAPREAIITIASADYYADRVVRTIKVKQVETEYYAEFPIKDYVISNTEQTFKVPYYANGDIKEITANCNVDWLTVEEINTDDEYVKVKALANNTGEPRSGIVAVTFVPTSGAPTTQYIHVTQSRTENILDVYVDEIEVSGNGEELVFPYYSNVDIEAKATSTWLKAEVKKEDGEIAVTVDANPTGEYRTSTVTIYSTNDKGEKKSKVIKISQRPRVVDASLYVTLPVKEFNINFEERDFKVPYLKIGDVKTVTATTNVTWVTYDSTDDDYINLDVDKNETGKARQAVVAIVVTPAVGAPDVLEIVINQTPENTYLAVPVTAYEISAASAEFDVPVEVSANGITVSAKSNAAWLTVTSADNTKITLTPVANNSAEARVASVSVIGTHSNGDDPEVYTVTVVQKGAPQYVVVPNTKFVENNTVHDVNIAYTATANVAVTASSNATWCTVDYSGAGVVKATLEANTGKARVAEVAIVGAPADGSEPSVTIVTIAQEGAQPNDLVVPTDMIQLPAEAITSHKVNFIATGDLTVSASSSAAWCEVVNVGTDFVELSVDENFGDPRKAVVTLVGTAAGQSPITVKVTVEQGSNYKYFAVPVTEFNSVVGGETVTINFLQSADVLVSAKSNAAWCTVGTIGTSSVSVTTTQNTGLAREAIVTLSGAPKDGSEPIVYNVVIKQEGVYVAPTFFEVPVVEYSAAVTGVISPDAIAVNFLKSADITVSAKSNAAWCTVGTLGTDNVPVTVAENTGAAREAIVTVTGAPADGSAPIVYNVVIKQAGVEVLPTFFEVPVVEYSAAVDGVLSPDAIAVNFLKSADITVSAKSNAAWCTVGTPGTDNVPVTVAENTGAAREAIVTVTGAPADGSAPIVYNVVIKQAGVEVLPTYFFVPITEFDATNAAGTLTASYIKSDDVTVTAQSNVAWCTPSIGTGKVTLTLTANTGADRQAIVTITGKTAKGVPTVETVVVRQAGVKFAFDVPFAQYVFGPDDYPLVHIPLAITGAKSTSVSTDAAWNIVSIESNGNIGLSFMGKPSEPRTCTITVKCTTQEDEIITKFISITQVPENNVLDVYSGEIVALAAGSTIELPVYSNLTNVSAASSGADWCTAAVASGKLTLTVAENNTGVARVSYVTVKATPASGAPVQKVIAVYQPAKEATLDVIPEVSFESAAGSKTLPVTTNGKFEVFTPETWITISNKTATGFDLGVTANSTTSREGKVYVYLPNEYGNRVVKAITVKQD